MSTHRQNTTIIWVSMRFSCGWLGFPNCIESHGFFVNLYPVVITHKFLRTIRNLKARAFRRESFDRLRTGFANSHGFLKPIRENS
jgi:hypothetical protein